MRGLAMVVPLLALPCGALADTGEGMPLPSSVSPSAAGGGTSGTKGKPSGGRARGRGVRGELEAFVSAGFEGTDDLGDNEVSMNGGRFLGFTGGALLRFAPWVALGIEPSYTFTLPSGRANMLGRLLGVPFVLRPTLPLSEQGSELYVQAGIGPVFGTLVPANGLSGDSLGVGGYCTEFVVGLRGPGDGSLHWALQGGARIDGVSTSEGRIDWSEPVAQRLTHVQLVLRAGMSWR